MVNLIEFTLLAFDMPQLWQIVDGMLGCSCECLRQFHKFLLVLSSPCWQSPSSFPMAPLHEYIHLGRAYKSRSRPKNHLGSGSVGYRNLRFFVQKKGAMNSSPIAFNPWLTQFDRGQHRCRTAAFDELLRSQNESQVLLWLSRADSESYQLAMERCPPGLAAKVYGQMLDLHGSIFGDGSWHLTQPLFGDTHMFCGTYMT